MTKERLGKFIPKHLRVVTQLGVAAAALLSVSACGNKVSFDVVPYQEAKSAPGFYTIPPKVDVSLFMDTTGSMTSVISQVNPVVKDFLLKLDLQNWDYHFAMLPLDHFQLPGRIAASVYDGNSTDWKAPYPGAIKTSVSSSYYSPASTYSDFLSTQATNGKEPGLETILSFYKSSFGTQTGFSRSDAMSIVMVVGNGNDTSKVNYCLRNDGSSAICENTDAYHPYCSPTATDPTGGNSSCGSDASSLDYYVNSLQALRPNLRFYAAVSSINSNNCLTGNSQTGTRYMKMAIRLGGKYFDFCSLDLGTVLRELTASLTAERRAFKTRYIFLNQDANPDTLIVKKVVDGDPNKTIVVPRSKTNGWDYEGNVQNVSVLYATSPKGVQTFMNTASGYAVRLYGDMELSGDDGATVEYKAAGASNSVSK